MSVEYCQKTENMPESTRKVAEPSVYQLELGVDNIAAPIQLSKSNREALIDLLSDDLDFRSNSPSHAAHNMHAFPAKFPPQLPRKFITGLTGPGNTVLDPMMGSGTTIVEAVLAGRNAIGFDIDPLARLIAQSKTTPIDPERAVASGYQVLSNASQHVEAGNNLLKSEIDSRFDRKTLEFIDYWFAKETQLELMALALEIESITDDLVRAFLELTFSGIIITKTGGVSLAFDLAHTRPHRAKVAYSPSGVSVVGQELAESDNPRIRFLTKRIKPALTEFKRKLQQNIASLKEIHPNSIKPKLREGNAQELDLPPDSVDLIVTSPPYASNAIDYMRAHKFSLVWFGYPVADLGDTRKDYIGGESLQRFAFEDLPEHTSEIISSIAKVDSRKAKVLHRYYSEMMRVLSEMQRVLKPDHAAIVVVASSVMRDSDTQTDMCLAEIGQSVGLDVPKIGVRNIDRNRRMMPAGFTIDRDSQIQQRMHQEFVIGFHKPSL